MLNATIALRAAAVLATVQYTAHSYLYLSSTPSQRKIDIPMIDAMKAKIINADRTYWDFYFGYGLLAILSGIVEIILLWQLAAIAKDHPGRLKPIVALLLIANVTHAAVIWQYFQIFPAIAFDLLVAGTLALALAARGRDA